VLYLKPPLSGGLCDGVMTMPSARPAVRARCKQGSRAKPPASGEFPAAGDHGFHAVRRQHFQCGFERGLRQRMRVDADVKRPVDILLAAVFADRLGNRQHVPFVETAFERTAAVARGPESNALRGHRRVGLQTGVGGEQLRHIDHTEAGAGCQRAG